VAKLEDGMHRYRIWLTDGERLMWTVLNAPDDVFAVMKARYFFAGTKWRVL
jgi:hypothetical protein